MSKTAREGNRYGSVPKRIGLKSFPILLHEGKVKFAGKELLFSINKISE